MIALANKEKGYEQVDADQIETLCVAFMEALNRKRAAEEALTRAHGGGGAGGPQATRDDRGHG